MSEPKTIDRAHVEHVAKLANLSLSPGEAERFTAELAAILGYVEELNKLDTREVPPTASVQLERSALRADEVGPSLSHEEAMSQAPRTTEGGFAVPAFVES